MVSKGPDPISGPQGVQPGGFQPGEPTARREGPGFQHPRKPAGLVLKEGSVFFNLQPAVIGDAGI